jgi:CRP-like cAMP-binding protein
MNLYEKLHQSFNQYGTTKQLEKGNFLIKEGEIEKNIYFISSGAVRLFYLSEYDEQTVRLGYTGSIINSLSSFLNAHPSEFYLEGIRKSTVQILAKENLMQLVHENQDNQQQYIQLLENLVTQQIDREIDLLITSPIERLKRVLQRSPNLFQEVPLKYIASYLRMTPETLSRIRKS